MTTIKLSTPQNWNELSKKQLLFVMKLFLKKLPHERFLILCLLKFSKIKLLKKMHFESGVFFYRLRKGRKRFLLTSGEIHQMAKSLSWLLKGSKLTYNPMPKVRPLVKAYYGPANFLFNITLSEFIFAEINFMSYCKSNQGAYLNNLLAILWRPKVDPYEPNSPNYKGDIREAFNDSTFTRRAKRLRLLKPHKKAALFTFYSGARTALQQEYPRVFSGDNSTSKPKNMAKEMLSLVRAVNGGDPTKNEKLLNLNVRDILSEMEDSIKKVDEIRRKGKRN